MHSVNRLEFFRKRKFIDKFSATFQFLKQNAWPFLKAQLFITAPVLILISILMNEFSGGLMAVISDARNINANDLIDLIGMYGLTLLSMLVTTTLIPSVTYGYMIQRQTKEPKDITLSGIMEGFSGRFFNILGFFFLLTLGISLLSMGIGFLSSALASAVGLIILVFTFASGLTVLVMSIVLFLGAPAIAFENGNPIDAFGRAFSLARGKWLSTFGLVASVGIIGLITSMLFAMPRGLTFGIEAFLTTNGDSTLAQMDQAMVNTPLSIFFSVLESLGTICLYSLVYIALAFQYFNLVERKESKGLMASIDEINAEDENEKDENY